MEKKLTKREMFTAMLEKYDFTDAERDFINHEIELLIKKNSGEKKPSANQIANEGLKDIIVEALGKVEGNGVTITDLIKSDARLGAYSNQKISQLVRQLILTNVVKKVEDKRKSYFSLV